MSETQKIMKLVTTWGRKTDQKYFFLINQENFLKQNYERQMQEDTFWCWTFPTISPKKIISQFAVPISQWKLELEKLELLPYDPPGPQDIPNRRVVWP